MTPEISFIVSAHNRPSHLLCCLAALDLQEPAHEIIVTDNSDRENFITSNRRVAFQFGAQYLATRAMGATHCYDSAELGLPLATGEWLCFPSDDTYLVPGFGSLMLHAAKENGLDLVYCDLVYDPRMYGGKRYDVFRVAPKLRHIDKNCFMVRRSRMIPFPEKGPLGDGVFIEALLRSGISHGKAQGVMVVHN